MVGQTISHYRIIEKLGEGGMGVVYKAEDLSLDRPVALKFLAPHLVSDEEGRQRFIREAKAAAALDHPNICTVHEIGEADGRTFIAMAFLEGQPLSKRIAQGPLKLNEVFSIAIQIAEGLEAAHAKGIVHRDIKPDNVMLIQGSRGLVKLMDFGLAQLSGSSKLTRGGSTLGTVFYMSPEQAQGADVDHRSDIWSLGIVLYEMVCGQTPFRGEFDQAVVYSLMNEQPEPLTAVRTGVPKELERIVNKCLAKAPASRYQHPDELLVDLRELQKEQSGVSQTRAMPAPVARPSRAPWYIGAAAAVVLVLAAAVFWPRPSGPSVPEPSVPLQVVPLTTDPGNEWFPTFSPDGTQVAFVWNGPARDNYDIYVQVVGSGNPLRLTTDPADDIRPRWSPDGRRITFDSDFKGNWDVFVVGAEGGPPRALTQTEGEDSRPSWSHDGRWIYFGSIRSGSYQVWKVSPEGGDAVQVTRGGGYNPLESPDGRFLYFAKGSTERGIWKLPVEGGEEAAVLPELTGAGGNARWAVKGKGVYFVEFKADASLGGRWLLRLLRADTGGVTDVMELPPPFGGACLDVSPDEQWLVYTQNDVLGSDLMLVENFK